jgi:hypothetical protein
MRFFPETKKASYPTGHTLSLVEAASQRVMSFGFIPDFSDMPRILRGNTKALEKLLLHASTKNVAYFVQ